MILLDTLKSIIQEFLTKSYHFGEDSVLVEPANGKLIIFVDSNKIYSRMYDNNKDTLNSIQTQLEDYLYYHLLIEKWLFEILFF